MPLPESHVPSTAVLDARTPAAVSDAPAPPFGVAAPRVAANEPALIAHARAALAKLGAPDPFPTPASTAYNSDATGAAAARTGASAPAADPSELDAEAAPDVAPGVSAQRFAIVAARIAADDPELIERARVALAAVHDTTKERALPAPKEAPSLGHEKSVRTCAEVVRSGILGTEGQPLIRLAWGGQNLMASGKGHLMAVRLLWYLEKPWRYC
ncbi:hypothetical protein AURDEDRAFT_122601 [Auricularia subglabra TFB-10046 SS5]|nr:hypothetical protein AURDEDRAFT_122601 [Auricularia subglabra TFB-10046 SS5]